jgi:hypothetical protein
LPRRAALAFGVAALAGIAIVLWRASGDERSVAFLFGAIPRVPAAVLPPHAEVCQTPIELQADVDAVSFPVKTKGHPGVPLTVTVRDLADRTLVRSRIAPGYPDSWTVTAPLPRLHPGQAISLCIRNDGTRTAYPLGEDAVVDSGTVQAGRTSTIDVALTFLRDRPRSALSEVPAMFRRAALFRFGWVGAWTFWVLAVAVLAGVPLLCGYALARAAREDDG